MVIRPSDDRSFTQAIPYPVLRRAAAHNEDKPGSSLTLPIRDIREVLDELLQIVEADRAGQTDWRREKGLTAMPPCDADQFRRDLEESIQDEIADVGFYAAIANEAPNDMMRLITTSIVGDEYGHARLQAALLGKNPAEISMPPASEATGDFETDVRMAIHGELSAVTRYARLAACAPTPEIRYLLTSIITDEYAHTRIWNAMLEAL